ncbi:hypothetical protein M9435_001513 [Picochlorum sp. BPE23]|nr:hypothetical protein M9435_001513 [Picochlorum sp. BPE23]
MMGLLARGIRLQRGLCSKWTMSLSDDACMAAYSSTQQQDLCKVTDIMYDSKENRVRVTFDSGEAYSYPSEYLRTQSPAAVKQSSSVVSGRKYVRIMDIRPVGRYGVQFCFDDLHTTGLFTYEYLLHLGRHKYSIMKQYLKALRSLQASRDPRRRSATPTTRKKTL